MPKVRKKYYSECDVADMLHMSIEQVRDIVKTHIVPDCDLNGASMPYFVAADLVVLKLLVAGALRSEALQQ
jgi:hypothetical protein